MVDMTPEEIRISNTLKGKSRMERDQILHELDERTKVAMNDGFYYAQLKENRNRISSQEYRMLKGQIKSGNGEAAMKGLQTILRRQNGGVRVWRSF